MTICVVVARHGHKCRMILYGMYHTLGNVIRKHLTRNLTYMVNLHWHRRRSALHQLQLQEMICVFAINILRHSDFAASCVNARNRGCGLCYGTYGRYDGVLPIGSYISPISHTRTNTNYVREYGEWPFHFSPYITAPLMHHGGFSGY